MKKTLLALSLIACLLLTFVGCEEDEIESEFKNNPTESVADSGTGDSNTTDGNGTTDTNDDGTSNTGLSGGGANTEAGWGPIITP
ncbi:MAG: hypothetical protein IKC59_01625 [Clostridia bacterium]|nr:hypothetical protein [Clostridia bacterium]